MTNPVIVLPDAEQIVVEFLLTSPEVAAIFDDRVGTELPGDEALVFPALVIRRVAGVAAVRRHLDAPEIQVDSWDEVPQKGGSKYRANLGARTALAALLTMHSIQGDLGVVSGVDEVIGPFERPDPKTLRPLYTFSVVVYVHPLPSRLQGS